MRKLVVSMMCILLLIGCKEKTVEPITVDFICDFTAEYNGMTVSGGLQRDMAGTLTLCVTSPDTLSGMVLRWDGNTAHVSLGDLQYTLETELPQAAAPQLILKILDALFYASQADTLVFDGAQLTGRIGEYAYAAQLDPQTGTLLSMEVPAAALSVRFSNVQKGKGE